MRLQPLCMLVLAVVTSGQSLADLDSPCGGFSSNEALGWVDGCGRQRFFWGLNVVYKGPPWLPTATQFDAKLSYTPDDAAFIRSFGCNAIRLGAMWPGVQPNTSSVDPIYIEQLLQTVEFSGMSGVFSLLDAHQDVMSAETCGEGLPSWAARDFAQGSKAFPLPLNHGIPFVVNESGIPSPADCAKLTWSEYYMSEAVCRMSDALYTRGGAAFGAFWASVASAVTTSTAANAFVIAYELLNEPWAGDILSDPGLLIPGVADRAKLQPFYENVTAAIRAAEAPSGHAHVVAVESVTWDDFFEVGFSDLPGGPTGRALSYHYYSAPNIEGAEGQVRDRVKDCARLGAACFLTEFEFGDVTNVPATLAVTDSHLQASDRTLSSESVTTYNASADPLQGAVGWEYKQFVPITGANSGAFTPNGSVSMPHVTAFARPRPEAIAGSTHSWFFDPAAATFNLSYTQRAPMNASDAVPSIVFLPALVWPSGANYSVCSQPPGAVTPSPWLAPPYSPIDAAAPNPFRWGYLVLSVAQGAPTNAEIRVNVTGSPIEQPGPGCVVGYAPLH